MFSRRGRHVHVVVIDRCEEGRKEQIKGGCVLGYYVRGGLEK